MSSIPNLPNLSSPQFFTDDNKILFFAIIIGAIFFFIIMPKLHKCWMREQTEMFADISNLPLRKFDQLKCSRSCCKNTQWPTGIPPEKTDMTAEELKNYIPSNFTCNWGKEGGCVCVTQQDYDYLSNKGGNISSGSC
jgi:hypothetical protein